VCSEEQNNERFPAKPSGAQTSRFVTTSQNDIIGEKQIQQKEKTPGSLQRTQGTLGYFFMPEKRRDDFVDARKLLMPMTFARRRFFRLDS
jgi:hypothetical protein